MSKIKEYVQKALTLEKTLYMQESLTKEYADILNNHRNAMEAHCSEIPAKPVLATVTKQRVDKQSVNPNSFIPKKPIKPTKPKYEKATRDLWLGIVSFLCCFGIFFPALETPEMAGFCAIVSMFFGIMSFKCFKDSYVSYKNDYERYNALLTKFENDLANFPKLEEELRANFLAEREKQEKIYQQRLVEVEEKFKKDKEKAEHDYSTNFKIYEQQMTRYNNTKKDMEELEVFYINLLQKHQVSVQKTKVALVEHYSSNVIYPKYQYFIAIASICEYLSSGRCDSLEGPDGAYNIYESELRQNLIINQLTSVLGDVNQIKTNQYLLYQELTDAENTVKSLSSSISSAPIELKDAVYNNYLESVNKLTTS